MLSHTMHEAAKAPDERNDGQLSQQSGLSAAELNINAHLSLLAECGLTSEQTRELYAVLDSIARGFVEYGWSGEICGKLLDGFQAVLSNAAEPVDSKNPHHEEKGDESR